MLIYRFDEHEIDLDVHEIRRAGEVVPVEPQVFDVLIHLVEHRARTVTKDELLDAVWGDRFVSESALTSRIKAARRAVGDDGQRQAVIRTVFGRGYRFVADVEQEIRSQPAADAIPAANHPSRPSTRLDGETPRPPRTHYATSGGHSVAYQLLDDRGATANADEAELPVVFVPGFVSNVELHWELPAMADTFRRLGRGRRLLLFDKRGTGVSERVALDRLPTLEERMDDVRAVMDAAGIERAALVGISEGGPLSLLFAAAHPDRVERIVLFGTYDHHPIDEVDELVERTRAYWGSGTAFEHLAPSWAGDPDLRRFLARFERLSATPEAAAAIVAMANDIDVRGILPSISQPTLIVHRTGDTVFPVRGARGLAAGIPDARLVELDGSDHLLFSDPDPVLDLVDEFLTDAPRAARPTSTSTALLTLVAVIGERSPTEVEVRDALERANPRAPVGDIAMSDAGVATVWAVDGPARAVRAAQLLVGDAGSDRRAGVHTAEVLLVDGRPSGPGLDLCIAAAERADSGTVLVTRTVIDLVAGSGLAFDVRDELEVASAPGRWTLATPVDRP